MTAACAGHSEPLWDATIDDETEIDRHRRHSRALAICRSCPIRVGCAAGVDLKHDDGVRGAILLPTIADSDRRSWHNAVIHSPASTGCVTNGPQAARLAEQDAARPCVNTDGPLTPPEPVRTTELSLMFSLSTAAQMVNDAHEQLAHARRCLYRALDERAAQPGRKPGECGTPAGYRRHQRADETPCWACVDANNRTKRQNRRAA